MKFNKATVAAALAIIGVIFLIIDTQTALHGAQDGIKICLQTVIPSLFPFILLSSIICRSFLGKRIGFMRPLNTVCGLADGAESLLLIGFIGGYPVGAKCIQDAYKKGYLSKTEASRMLAFCNNAGPAFIFGITSQLFAQPTAAWLIWCVQILSALLVGIILSKVPTAAICIDSNKPPNWIEALEQSIKTIAGICGWIVIFRTMIAILECRLIGLLPTVWQSVFVGILELANGCLGLLNIHNEALKFLLCNTFLSFGGLCILMQTASVAKNLSISRYFLGKVLQVVFSLYLSMLIISIFTKNILAVCLLFAAGLVVGLLNAHRLKNSSRNIQKAVV